MKKIELNVLTFILIEALYLLYMFKVSIINVVLGTIISIIIIFITKKKKIFFFPKLLFLLISLILTIITICQITHFINYNILKNYPSFIIMLTIFILALYLTNKGYHTYIKSLEITFYFFIFIKITSFILLISNINLTNLNYQLMQEISINYSFILPTIMILFVHFSIQYLTNTTIKAKSYIIGIINPIIWKLITISIMGVTLFNLYVYPYFNVLKSIKYLDFIERMEGILSFQYLITFFFLLSFLLLIIKSISQELFCKKINIHY